MLESERRELEARAAAEMAGIQSRIADMKAEIAEKRKKIAEQSEALKQ